MKILRLFKTGVAQSFLWVGFLLFIGCTDSFRVQAPSTSSVQAVSPYESEGQVFYQRLQMHAMDDPFRGYSSSTRQLLTAKFEDLKAKGAISYESVLNQAIADGYISKPVKDIVLGYNRDILTYAKEYPDSSKIQAWCLDRDNLVKNRQDLSENDKRFVLTHQVLIKYYIKYSVESLPQQVSSSQARLKTTENWQDIWCYFQCGINNISSFSSVGALADGEREPGASSGPGTLIGAGAGLIYTILNPDACSCGSKSCGYATGISTPDVCYSAANGLPYSAWGYGQTPIDFVWEFYREDISNAPIRRTTGDQYTLTDAELNGASKVAVRLSTNCAGIYYYSAHYWTAPSDNGKPRPSISVYQSPNNPNQVQYVVSGANIQSFQWSYIPPYRGSVISQSGNSITVQWQPNLRIGVNVDTSSPCGTASTSAY